MNSASNGPYLPRIEWEALQNKWEIEDLKESPALPPGAERITVWRNDQYKLEAQVTGTPVGRAKDMLPNFGPPGTMFPDLDVGGSSTGGRVEYKLSHCVPGRISVKGGESFEAELTTYRLQRRLVRAGISRIRLEICDATARVNSSASPLPDVSFNRYTHADLDADHCEVDSG